MKSVIKKIGFEIEGEFGIDFVSVLERMNGEIKGDGSVHQCNHALEPYHNKFQFCTRTGEYASEVFDVNNIAYIKQVFDIFQKQHESGQYHWNRSAGFHVHVSFDPVIPPEIKHDSFVQYALEIIKESFPKEYAERHTGSYCEASGINNNFILKPNSRYKAINFESFRKHGTLEFRIFPANEPIEMYRYLNKVIMLINGYLNKKISISEDVETNQAIPLTNEHHASIYSDANTNNYLETSRKKERFPDPSVEEIIKFCQKNYNVENIFDANSTAVPDIIRQMKIQIHNTNVIPDDIYDSHAVSFIKKLTKKYDI